MSSWGRDGQKWLIGKLAGTWRVYPPVGSTVVRAAVFPSFEEARAYFAYQADGWSNYTIVLDRLELDDED